LHGCPAATPERAIRVTVEVTSGEKAANATTQFALVFTGILEAGALAGVPYPTEALEMASAVIVDEAAFDHHTGTTWRFSECRGIYPCMAAMKTRQAVAMMNP
jgi:hypothetical protein